LRNTGRGREVKLNEQTDIEEYEGEGKVVGSIAAANGNRYGWIVI